MISLVCLIVLCWAISPGQTVHNCQGKQANKYKLDFIATWSSKTHPGTSFLKKRRFSASIGASHNSNYTMWAPGSSASSGLQEFAQNVNNRNTLQDEITEQISKKNVIWEVAFGHFSPFNKTLELRDGDYVSVSGQFPLVSAISMISLSPDWFVGVHDLNLCGGQSFKNHVARDLFVYDAGMDNGTKFDSPTRPTNPPVKIFKITKDMDTPFKSNTTIPRLGYLVFTKTEERETAVLSTTGSPTTMPTLSTMHMAGNQTTPKSNLAANSFATEAPFTCLLLFVFVIIFQSYSNYGNV